MLLLLLRLLVLVYLQRYQFLCEAWCVFAVGHMHWLRSRQIFNVCVCMSECPRCTWFVVLIHKLSLLINANDYRHFKTRHKSIARAIARTAHISFFFALAQMKINITDIWRKTSRETALFTRIYFCLLNNFVVFMRDYSMSSMWR